MIVKLFDVKQTAMFVFNKMLMIIRKKMDAVEHGNSNLKASHPLWVQKD